MKYLSLIAIFFAQFSFAGSTDSGTGIRFEETTFAELLNKAKAENKMIMIDAYTSWCGPCKWMVKNVFPTDTAGEFYNKNFISAKYDMEKGEGIELAKKYQVTCYPTYLFIDQNGNLMHRVSSAMFAAQFVEVGKTALSPEKRFATMQRKYESGNATAEETAAYILMRGGSCMSVKDEMEKYFQTQKDEEMTLKRNWDILNECRMSITYHSKPFKYLTGHSADYAALYTQKAVDELIKSSYTFALYNFARAKDTTGYAQLKNDIKGNSLEFGEELIIQGDMNMYKAKANWKEYASLAKVYAEKYIHDNSNGLNSLAWTYYEKIDDPALLKDAAEWARRSVELKEGYANTDTYAAVLFKLGMKAEAQAAAEKAIELAKKEGTDYADTSALLEKIKSLK